MFTVQTLLLAFSAAVTLVAATSPTSYEDGETIAGRSVTPNSQGMNNGFFYSMWSDGSGDVEYTNGPAGQYSLTWSNSGDVVVGKGFSTGAARTITYNADYQPSGISFLSVYGWFTDPLTEYYICENYGSGSPAGGDGMVHKGQLESDGSTYDVYAHQQVNAPSIRGTTNFMQYWSIRNQTRTSGTINTANHYNYWKSIGLSIGTFGYQVLATEGVKSSGKSTVTVSEGGADAEPSASMSSSSAAAASTASSVESASSATPVASSASSTPYSATTSAISSAAAVTIPSVVPSSAPYGNSLSSVAAPSSSSAMDSSPTFGGQAPGAGVPFGSGSSHLTPGSMPTPRVRHHGHHRHGGYYEHLNRNVYPGGY